MVQEKEFTKYERARIIGARGLQVSMDAPLLLDLSDEELHSINYDPLKIAEKELDSGVLPISVNKPMPLKTEDDLSKMKVKESRVTDEEKERAEAEGEKEIAESGEIMELTNTDEEKESEPSLNQTSPELE